MRPDHARCAQVGAPGNYSPLPTSLLAVVVLLRHRSKTVVGTRSRIAAAAATRNGKATGALSTPTTRVTALAKEAQEVPEVQAAPHLATSPGTMTQSNVRYVVSSGTVPRTVGTVSMMMH